MIFQKQTYKLGFVGETRMPPAASFLQKARQKIFKQWIYENNIFSQAVVST